MTLYLKLAVGGVRYLLGAAQIVEIDPAEEPPPHDADARAVDCRRLFGEPATAPGYRIRLAPGAGVAAMLLVDRVDGLVELGEAAFRPLPAIGRFGILIDAVSIPVGDEPPALRLRAGLAELGGALFRGECDGRSGDPAAS